MIVNDTTISETTDDRSHLPSSQKVNPLKSTTEKFNKGKIKKFCKYHKSFGHKTDECRSINTRPLRESKLGEKQGKKVSPAENKSRGYGNKENKACKEDRSSNIFGDTYTNIVIEGLPNPENITFNATISNKNVLITVDTGSKLYYIKRNRTESLRLAPQFTQTFMATFGNSNKQEINSKL